MITVRTQVFLVIKCYQKSNSDHREKIRYKCPDLRERNSVIIV